MAKLTKTGIVLTVMLVIFQGFSRADSEQVTKVYCLQNTSAVEIAKVLKSRYADSEVKPAIVADKRTNSLLVTAPAEVQKEIETMVGMLDSTGAQLLIEISLAEGSHAVFEEIGIDCGSLEKGKIIFATVDPNVREKIVKANAARKLSLCSAPKVTTLDRAPAQVRISYDIPYKDTIAWRNDVPELAYKRAGIFCQFTPYVREDGIAIAGELNIRHVLGKTEEEIPKAVFIKAKEVIFNVSIEDGGTIAFSCLGEDENKAIAVFISASIDKKMMNKVGRMPRVIRDVELTAPSLEER